MVRIFEKSQFLFIGREEKICLRILFFLIQSARINTKTMQKYICTNCQAIYDPLFGDEENEIEVGTSFESIWESWVCPICFASKDFFFSLPEIVHDPISEDMMSDLEYSHIPRFIEYREKIYVWIGDEDGYSNNKEHQIIYVGIFDEDGEIIDIIKINPTILQEWFIFDFPLDESYEIRAACNIHGVWRGVRDESLLENLPTN